MLAGVCAPHNVQPIACGWVHILGAGMQQVDALRWLLKTEPTEVYAAGTNGSGAADDINAYEALSLT